MKHIFALLLIFTGILAAGCGGKKAAEKEGPGPLAQARPAPAVFTGEFNEYTEPTNYTQQGIGLHGRSIGNVLYISMANRSNAVVELLASDIAIIYGPRRGQDILMINSGTADIRSFIPLKLQPGERGVTVLRIRDLDQLRGLRMVYNNPRQNIVTYTDIQ